MNAKYHARSDEFYEALLARNPQYLGSFVVGVTTTGIFCLPTCRARKPRRENVEFFPGAPDALRAGYRPCRICRPCEAVRQQPPDVIAALRLLGDTDSPRVRDADLRDAGLKPATVRRWFKREYGITFQAYQRMIRLNASYQALRSGSDVLEAGMAGKYESASGFYRAYEAAMRESPAASRDRILITLKRIDTPIGAMLAGATDSGVCLLEFTDRRMLETQLDVLLKRLDARYLYGGHPHLEQLQDELAGYFEGRLRAFNVPLLSPGTPFQQGVWLQLRSIPYGDTRSYAEQALAIGRPRATRAVASANGQNRIAIVIPCHRVIGSDGSPTGYGGGIARKQWLLQHERTHTVGS